MRAFISGDEYQGTPEEISRFLSLREGTKYDYSPAPDTWGSVLADSTKLREQLETFPGVVPSNDTTEESNTVQPNTFTPPDTGVVLE